jgi:hypothetical protein
MVYSVGGLIQAVDYNNFIGNVNDVWADGSSRDRGYMQSARTTVSANTNVTATAWATLVNTLASMGSHQGTTITSRTAPSAGQLVNILANVSTDITNLTTNRGNAAAVGTTSTTWTGSTAKTTGTGSGGATWTITWTHTITWTNFAAVKAFFNAGGRVFLTMNKSSTGTDSDADWNTFISGVGTISITGISSGTVNLAGTSYNGVTRTGGGAGVGVTAIVPGNGYYTLLALRPGAQTLWTGNSATSPYTSDQVRITGEGTANADQLILRTTWTSAARTGAGQNTTISGGTDTTSPFGSFGTAPAVVCRFTPPSTNFLTNTWGTPTVAASVA